MPSSTLLVEGDDDEHVLRHIGIARGISDLVKIENLRGSANLPRRIRASLRASEGNDDVVGVVIDADANPNARWQSIRDIFIQAGYQNIPTRHNTQGTIIEPPVETILPRTGVWIMPDNQAPGKLEDFLRLMVLETDTLIGYANDVVDNIPEQRFSHQDRPKAVMHTWLAWQSEPGRPYGTAIKARFLDPDVPQVNVLVSWLERLFSQPGNL